MSGNNSGTAKRACSSAEKAIRREMGQRIEDLRTERRWSQERLGRKVGTSRHQVGRWENGTHMPQLGHLIALSAALEVTIDELVSGRPPRLPHPKVLSLEERRRAAQHLNGLAALLKLPTPD